MSRRLRAGSSQSVNMLRSDWAGTWRLEQWDDQPDRSAFACRECREWRELPLRVPARRL